MENGLLEEAVKKNRKNKGGQEEEEDRPAKRALLDSEVIAIE